MNNADVRYRCFIMKFQGEDWVTLIHGVSRSDARERFLTVHWGEGEWIDIRGERLEGLDDKPITFDNAKAAGFVYVSWEYDEEGNQIEKPDQFINDCYCPVCRGHDEK